MKQFFFCVTVIHGFYDSCSSSYFPTLIKVLKYNVYDFEECEPTKPDTRRFSIQPTYGGIYEDVVIGDSYDEGTVRFYGVKEDAFLCFMVKKFGEEYYEWYKDHEKVKTFGIITKLLSEYEEKFVRALSK